MIKIRCLIVDDEPPAVTLLEKYAGMIDQLEVVGTCQSAVRAFDILKDKKVDLLFLDIQMPVLNGIDFIKTLKNPPAVILTTAYREYALDGYDLDIVDYLLKPIAFDRFLRAVDRYGERISKLIEKTESIATLDHIFFTINRSQHKVVLSAILYIESLKDYVRLHLTDERIVVKGNIGSMMKKLPADRFIRIHRSYAVAKVAVRSYNHTEATVGNVKLPVSASYRNDFLEAMS